MSLRNIFMCTLEVYTYYGNFKKCEQITLYRDQSEYFGFEIAQCAQPSELNIHLFLC